jgi:hypothetical protein
MAIDIYIASTLTDLAAHREAVKAVIPTLRDAGNVCFQYVGVEYRTPDTMPPLKEYFSALDKASIVIMLAGWRYGFLPEGSDKSVLELEYERALAGGKSIICYLMDDSYPVSPNLIESGEGAARLKEFKNRLKRQHTVEKFSSPDDLARKVAVDLTRYYTRGMEIVAEDIIVRPRLTAQLKDCEEANRIHQATIDSLRQRLENSVPAEPIWTTRNFRKDSTLCFVLMPFAEEFYQVYEEALAPAASAAGLRCSHAGEIFDNREIVEDIWESICTSQVIVADVTHRNPNVFYELGICHTLGKEVIVVTQNSEDVPFDIRHRRFIEYAPAKLASLRARLERTIRNVVVRVGMSHDDEEAQQTPPANPEGRADAPSGFAEA